MRLIDADALLHHLSRLKAEFGTPTYRRALNDALNDFFPQIIKNAPSIDPHKHGQWREVGITMEYHHYTCSACKHNVKSPGRFCPNCGARMDGGEEQ